MVLDQPHLGKQNYPLDPRKKFWIRTCAPISQNKLILDPHICSDIKTNFKLKLSNI